MEYRNIRAKLHVGPVHKFPAFSDVAMYWYSETWYGDVTAVDAAA